MSKSISMVGAGTSAYIEVNPQEQNFKLSISVRPAAGWTGNWSLQYRLGKEWFYDPSKFEKTAADFDGLATPIRAVRLVTGSGSSGEITLEVLQGA